MKPPTNTRQRISRFLLLFIVFLVSLAIYSCSGGSIHECPPYLSEYNGSDTIFHATTSWEPRPPNAEAVSPPNAEAVSPPNAEAASPTEALLQISFDSYLESLNMIKDWSSGLVTVNSGLIALTGALVKDITEKRALKQSRPVFACFLFSILAGANVIGSLPSLLLHIDPDGILSNPYSLPGNLGIPLVVSCNLQIGFFAVGLISFFRLFSNHKSKNNVNIEIAEIATPNL